MGRLLCFAGKVFAGNGLQSALASRYPADTVLGVWRGLGGDGR
jgi:hypothetical protein